MRILKTLSLTAILVVIAASLACTCPPPAADNSTLPAAAAQPVPATPAAGTVAPSSRLESPPPPPTTTPVTEPTPPNTAPPTPDSAPPTPPDASAAAEGPGQGEPCPTNVCAAGLTCVAYYGIAGPRGPKFTSCEIRCGKDTGACPDGQTCRTIADGPGSVCRAK